MRDIIEKLRSATLATAYEGRLYLVGGIVRDRLMGLPTDEDIDIVLEGDAAELAGFLYASGLSQNPPTIYSRFGTAMLAVDGARVELVGARKESYDPSSRKPATKPGSLLDDVLRRDFTINTLLENLHSGEILDLTGKAHNDITNKVIRTPLDPMITFDDDPLRMLRAIRFATRFGFAINKQTYVAIRERAHRLSIISAERMRGEFEKILMTQNAVDGMEMLRKTGLMSIFAPEIAALYGVEQNIHHRCDVWNHTLAALESIPVECGLMLRLTALLHDVGKVATKSVDEAGGVHFYGHEKVGAELAERFLKRLTFSNQLAEEVAFLISMHLRVGSYSQEWTDTAMRRLIRDAGEHLNDLILLAEADGAAAKNDPKGGDLSKFREHLAQVRLELHGKEIKSPLDGREIMEVLGLDPGPKVGEAQRFLEEQVVKGRLRAGDKAGARKLLLEPD